MFSTPLNTILSRPSGPTLHRARRLLDISIALNTLRDPEELLRYIIDTATEVIQCKAASLLLYDEAEQRLRFVAATGENSEALADIPVPLDGSIAGAIFRENRPIIVSDTQQDERHFDGVAKQTGVQTSALLGVPMCIDGYPIGVFEVLNPKDGSFSDDDVETLLVMAAQAAVAIENVRQRRALREARDRLAGLDRLKSDFMALASHELRTPLAIILGCGDLLRSAAGPDTARFAEDVMRAGGRMHEVIETLEEMSFLQDEASELVLTPTVLQATIHEAWDKAGVVTSGLNTVLDMPEQPFHVEADPRRLQLVFVTLFKNALALTPDGGTLQVTLCEEHGDAYLQMQDSGPGLSETDCTRIFDPFYQVEDHLTRSHEGMGMGLTIASACVRLHRGRLWAESEGLGQGSTFHLRLPLASGNTAEVA